MVAILTQDLLGIGQIRRSILSLIVHDCIDVQVPRGYREHRQQQELRDILFGLRCVFRWDFQVVPIRNSSWKRMLVAAYERREGRGTKAGRGRGEREGKQCSHTHYGSPSNPPGTALYGSLAVRGAYT